VKRTGCGALRWPRQLGLWVALMLGASALTAADRSLVWPTPNRAFLEGKTGEHYLQPTSSGRLESALFGCVRNGGRRFHEGIDLRATQWDRSGESTDPIFAIMPGRVAYVNRVAGHSGYGRYLVLEHRSPGLTFYSLYAHLRSIPAEMVVDREVVAGEQIGVMGRSAGGYTIPRSRAHLHLEIGFQLQRDFDRWFSRQGFGSRNHHGAWNGMNLSGMDPLDYYQSILSGRAEGMREYLETIPVAVRVRVPQGGIPDFVRRNPAMVPGGIPSAAPAGWEIDFTWFGMPVRWRPLSESAVREMNGEVRLVALNEQLLRAHGCREMVTWRGENASPGSFLVNRLNLLFPERLR